MPTLIKSRAQRAWSKRGIQWSGIEERLTEDERAAVKEQWDQLPGHTSWMDAFFLFLNGTADPRLMGADGACFHPARTVQGTLNPRFVAYAVAQRLSPDEAARVHTSTVDFMRWALNHWHAFAESYSAAACGGQPLPAPAQCGPEVHDVFDAYLKTRIPWCDRCATFPRFNSSAELDAHTKENHPDAMIAPPGMVVVSKDRFFRAVGADPRDVMPDTSNPDYTLWKTRTGVIVGRTLPGWKHPGAPPAYALTAEAAPDDSDQH